MQFPWQVCDCDGNCIVEFLNGHLSQRLIVNLRRVTKYRVIRNECQGFNYLSYTIDLRQDYMYFFV